MGDLTDAMGVPLQTDNEKKNGLIRNHFGWRNEGRKVDKEEGERERYPGLTGINSEEICYGSGKRPPLERGNQPPTVS